MEICDINHLHKRFLDIWEWCMRQGFDTRAFTYVENAFKSEPTAELVDHKTENSSEKPNNCEHITEDGVTCAKYPACDDCPDNPLNKVKGSERLVKGSEQTDLVEDSPSLVKDLVKAFGEDGTWLERQGVYTLTLAEAKQRAVDIIESVLAKDEPTISKMEQVEDEPQTDLSTEEFVEGMKNLKMEVKQTDCKGCDRYEDGGELCDMCALENGKKDAQTDCSWK